MNMLILLGGGSSSQVDRKPTSPLRGAGFRPGPGPAGRNPSLPGGRTQTPTASTLNPEGEKRTGVNGAIRTELVRHGRVPADGALTSVGDDRVLSPVAVCGLDARLLRPAQRNTGGQQQEAAGEGG